MYDFIKIEVHTTLFWGKSNVLMFGQNTIIAKKLFRSIFFRGRNYKRKSGGKQRVTFQKI